MPELTPEEQEILEKLERDNAASEAIPASEKTPVGQPDKYAAPIGVGDDGKPLGGPKAKPEDLAAKLQETSRRIAEGFQTATDRIRNLGDELQRRAREKAVAEDADQAEPTGAPAGSTDAPAEPREGAANPFAALADALAGKAPAAGSAAPFVGAVRQLEQTLAQLGRVVGAAATPEGREVIAGEVRRLRDTMREGDSPTPTETQREAVHERLTALWHTLSTMAPPGAGAPVKAPEAAEFAAGVAAGPTQEAAAGATQDSTPPKDPQDTTLKDTLAELLHALETGAASPEEVEARIAALRARPEPHVPAD